MASDIDAILGAAPVIPILVIDKVEDAVPIARALVAGGLRIIEVTLRTPAAIDAIRAMATVEGAIVGAGTILTPSHVEEAAGAGAQFLVSPGLTRPVAQAARDSNVPLLPGAVTPSEIMRALDMGFTRLKFFPSVASGGIPTLEALSPVFPQVRFCPTAGITAENAADWLALPAVACVGGTWFVPDGEPVDEAAIAARAREAAALRR